MISITLVCLSSPSLTCTVLIATVFCSPLPNSKIWVGSTIGRLQNEDVFVNGGWWHDPRILSVVGEGIEKEEPRGWKGWWNEKIVWLERASQKWIGADFLQGHFG
jgi:hypothetical protein